MVNRNPREPERSTVSESELEILKVLWNQGPLKVGEVLISMRTQGFSWAYNTVQTLLNRLKNKGFVATVKKGRALTYRPLVDRQAFVSQKIEEVATRVFDGATSSMVLALVERQRFTKAEIERFKTLVDRLSKESDETGS